MTIRKSVRILILVMAMILIGLLAVGCNGSGGGQDAQSNAISVNNDATELGSVDTTPVIDPNAGKILKPVQSTGVQLEVGITSAPPTYDPKKDLLNAATGKVPTIVHGSANGDDCISCHGAKSAEVPLPQSHVTAGIGNDYCRNCHKD